MSAPDILATLKDYTARVAQAPLLSEAELHRKAFEILTEHASMIDACMVDEQTRALADPNGGPAVARHIEGIRTAIFNLKVLVHKRETVTLAKKAGLL